MKNKIIVVLLILWINLAFSLSVNIADGGDSWCILSTNDIIDGVTEIASPPFGHYVLIVEGAARKNIGRIYQTKNRSMRSKFKNVPAKIDRMNWHIDVSKSDTTPVGGWPAELELYVKRTSAGDPEGGITDGAGTTYQEITGVDTQFFNGSGNVSDINIQLKFEGISLETPEESYGTQITFTIVED